MLDCVYVLTHKIIIICAQGKFCHANYRIHGSTYFMAHLRKKVAFCTASLFGKFFCRDQISYVDAVLEVNRLSVQPAYELVRIVVTTPGKTAILLPFDDFVRFLFKLVTRTKITPLLCVILKKFITMAADKRVRM